MANDLDCLAKYMEGMPQRFVLYGCGRFGASILERLLSMGIRPLGICDADEGKKGCDLLGYAILTPRQALEQFGYDTVFLVAIVRYTKDKSIRGGLEGMLPGFRFEFFPLDVYHDCDAAWRARWFSAGIRDGALFLDDRDRPGYRVTNGERATLGQPETTDRTCFILGDSVAMSLHVSDAATLATHLQKKCNADRLSVTIRNFGLTGPFGLRENMFLCLDALPIRRDDIVFVVVSTIHLARDPGTLRDTVANMYYECRKRGVFLFVALVPALLDDNSIGSNREDIIDDIRNYLAFLGCPSMYLRDCLRSLPAEMVKFHDKSHLTDQANERCAEELHARLSELFAVAARTEHASATALQKLASVVHAQNVDKPDVREWIASVRTQTPASAGTVRGAVVVNCNPFTNGHLHLIEYAARSVDFLYVFVVEEDRSFFPFAERLDMVRKGVRHLGDRVGVFPSGKFIISALTFPGYFEKEKIISKIDPSYDVLFFGAIIARELGISRRFMGEEPYCAVTSRYNATMLRILPAIGVETCVIPRKTSDRDCQAISASAVREAMRRGDWNAIAEMVPEDIFENLLRTYNNPDTSGNAVTAETRGQYGMALK